MSRFAVSYACRNFSRLCRSDTGSPDETSVRPSLPRMLTSPLVSPPRSAAADPSASATTGCSSRAIEAPAAGVATIAEALRVPPTTEAVERAGLATLEPTGLPDAAGAGRRRLRAAISEAACGLLADRALLRSTSLLTEPALLADRTPAGP